MFEMKENKNIFRICLHSPLSFFKHLCSFTLTCSGPSPVTGISGKSAGLGSKLWGDDYRSNCFQTPSVDTVIKVLVKGASLLREFNLSTAFMMKNFRLRLSMYPDKQHTFLLLIACNSLHSTKLLLIYNLFIIINH